MGAQRVNCLFNPAFWHRQSCVLPPKKRRLFSIHLMMHLMMRQRTSPTPIGRTPGFLFKWISLRAMYAPRDISDTFSVAR